MVSRMAIGLLLAIFLVVPAAAQQKTKLQNVMELVRVSGMETTLDAIMVPIIQQGMSSPAFARLPAGERQTVQTLMVEEFQNLRPEFVRRLGEIWAKHFTNDEVVGLIRFYKSPLGRKIVDKTPQAMQEAQTAGYSWGLEVGKRVVERMRNRRRR